MAGEPTDDTASTASHYERIGGAPALQETVERFYAKVLDDPELATYFEGQDVGRIKRHQVKLLSQVLGGPQEYEGRELSDAHAHLRITEAHYDQVVNHLVATMVELGVPDDVIADAGAVVADVKPGIVASGDAATS
ncbi:MAG TPA: group 1 truncated hemoglobin [Acidimicrobiales bacterium]|nr:group 1 truncated hemoglobin [Acidimicrobiales bacterium]